MRIACQESNAWFLWIFCLWDDWQDSLIFSEKKKIVSKCRLLLLWLPNLKTIRGLHFRTDEVNAVAEE